MWFREVVGLKRCAECSWRSLGLLRPVLVGSLLIVVGGRIQPAAADAFYERVPPQDPLGDMEEASNPIFNPFSNVFFHALNYLPECMPVADLNRLIAIYDRMTTTAAPPATDAPIDVDVNEFDRVAALRGEVLKQISRRIPALILQSATCGTELPPSSETRRSLIAGLLHRFATLIEVRQLRGAELRDLRSLLPGISAMMLISPDGFEDGVSAVNASVSNILLNDYRTWSTLAEGRPNAASLLLPAAHFYNGLSSLTLSIQSGPFGGGLALPRTSAMSERITEGLGSILFQFAEYYQHRASDPPLWVSPLQPLNHSKSDCTTIAQVISTLRNVPPDPGIRKSIFSILSRLLIALDYPTLRELLSSNDIYSSMLAKQCDEAWQSGRQLLLDSLRDSGITLEQLDGTVRMPGRNPLSHAAAWAALGEELQNSGTAQTVRAGGLLAELEAIITAGDLETTRARTVFSALRAAPYPCLAFSDLARWQAAYDRLVELDRSAINGVLSSESVRIGALAVIGWGTRQLECVAKTRAAQPTLPTEDRAQRDFVEGYLTRAVTFFRLNGGSSPDVVELAAAISTQFATLTPAFEATLLTVMSELVTAVDDAICSELSRWTRAATKPSITLLTRAVAFYSALDTFERRGGRIPAESRAALGAWSLLSQIDKHWESKLSAEKIRRGLLDGATRFSEVQPEDSILEINGDYADILERAMTILERWEPGNNGTTKYFLATLSRVLQEMNIYILLRDDDKLRPPGAMVGDKLYKTYSGSSYREVWRRGLRLLTVKLQNSTLYLDDLPDGLTLQGLEGMETLGHVKGWELQRDRLPKEEYEYWDGKDLAYRQDIGLIPIKPLPQGNMLQPVPPFGGGLERLPDGTMP